MIAPAESGRPRPPAPPLVRPLGDRGVLVRFADSLDDGANRAAIAFARRLEHGPPAGVLEVVPGLVSVLLRYDPLAVDFDRLAGELRLRLAAPAHETSVPVRHIVAVRYGGDDGPDLDEIAAAMGMTPSAFVGAHVGQPVRVLAAGFAPGFLYCGFAPPEFDLPRRTAVRDRVPAGAVLFAARQTAIAATPIPTGWHVIGRTDFRHFDPLADPPSVVTPGDEVVFEAIP